MKNKYYKNCKKDIKELDNYNRGFYCNFWLGWIHCLHELDKITEEEGMELEDFLMRGFEWKKLNPAVGR